MQDRNVGSIRNNEKFQLFWSEPDKKFQMIRKYPLRYSEDKTKQNKNKK